MSEVAGVMGAGLSGGGVLGGQAAAPTGLAGLFAALLGTGTAAGTGGLGGDDALAGLLAGLQNSDGTIDGDVEAALFAKLGDKLGLPSDNLQDAHTVVVQAALIQLRDTIAQLQQAGVTLPDIGDSKQLAAALTKLGMDPDEAAGKAMDIDQMLDLVKEAWGKKDDDATTPGDMLQMIASNPLVPLASPLVQQDVSQIHLVQIDIHTTTTLVSATKAFAKPQTGAANLARMMSGIADDADVPTEGEVSFAADTDDAVDALPGKHDKKVDDGKDGLPVPTAVKTDTPVAVAAVVAATPDVSKSTSKSDADKMKIDAANRASKAGTLVEAGQVALPPEGTEVMRVRADADGNEVTERKLDAGTLRSMNGDNSPVSAGSDSGTQAAMQGLTGSPAHADAKTHASFADRLAHATRADVTHQAVVQVKNVIDDGGGTVRIILNPPELGEIRVEMTISNGKVDGAISATDNAVVELLARDVHSLKQGLADAGLKLGDQGLALMLNNGNQQNPQGQQGQNAQAGQPQGHGRTGAEEMLAAEVAAVDAATWVSPDKLVDVRI